MVCDGGLKLGKRGMTGCTKDRKEWRALVYMLTIEYTAYILA